MRWFYFMIDKYAAVLVRSPRSPRLIFYENAVWDVRLTGDSNNKLDWMLRPREPGLALGPPIEIDLRYEVHYIRKLGSLSRPAEPQEDGSDGEPHGLEIVFKNGTVLSFTGGLYLHAPLLEQVVESLDLDGPDAGSFDVVRAANSSNATIVKNFVHKIVDSTRRKTEVVALVGHASTHGLVAGAGTFLWGSGLVYGFAANLLDSYVVNSGWARTVDIVNFGLSFTPISSLPAVGSTVASSVGMWGGTPAAVFMLTLKGAAAGAATGLAMGLATGLTVGAYTAVMEWYKQSRYVHLSASEKIYQKLACHASFTQCCQGNVLVPLGAECPELPSCETETEDSADWDEDDVGPLLVSAWA